MNAQTHTLGNGARVGDSTVRRQLDMLAAGQMDEATFLRATIARLRDDPDENWEVLSLLDQYFRLNKIPGETFRAVKNGLAEFVLRPRGAPPVQASQHTVQLTPRTSPPPAAAVSPSAVTMPTSAVTETRVLPALRDASSASRAAPTVLSTAAVGASVAAPAAAPAQERERDLIAGDVLRGRYRVEGLLGQGGRGMVYSATDAYRLDGQPAGQRVAIKVLQRALAKRPDAVLELRREFQLLQSLTHPNIVRVHEFDKDGSLSFFSMEMLNGVLLSRVAQARRQRPLSRAHALAIIRDIGAAAAFAHSRGVIHGDINPQNIFVTFDGEVRVLDFGAARRARRDTPFLGEDEGHSSFATVGYASPQVMGGEYGDVQDDIFSLACVAYVLLSGQHPFHEASSLQAQAERIKPKRLAHLKDGAWRALRQALQFDRAKRPASVAEFLSKLDIDQAATHLPNLNDLLESPGGSRTRIPGGALALGLLVLGGATYAYLVREDILPAPGETLPPPAGHAMAPAAGTEVAAPTVTPPAGSTVAGRSPSGSAAPVRTPAPTPSVSATARTPAPTPAPGGGAAMRPAPAPLAAAAPVPGAMSRSASPARVAADAAPVAAPTTRIPPSSAAATPMAVDSAAPSAAAVPRIATTARVELATDTVDVVDGESVAHVVVRRKGTLHGEAPFSWWTESGTAKPGTDFEAASAHVDRIPDGAASMTISIPLTMQTMRAQPKSFYVVIDQSDGGAIVSGRTLTMITLPGTN